MHYLCFSFLFCRRPCFQAENPLDLFSRKGKRDASRLICGLYKHSPVFRVGGDEFVVLLQNEDFEQREALLEELNRRVEENIRTGRAVVSAGMADYEPGDQQVDAVLRRADQRMYERKKQLKEMGAAIRE